MTSWYPLIKDAERDLGVTFSEGIVSQSFLAEGTSLDLLTALIDDELADVLMIHGIGLDGEITQYGLRVESWIDKFNEYRLREA